jgi:hypothetical protein
MAKTRRKSKNGTASSRQAVLFVTTLQKDFRARKRSPKERERLRKYLATFPPDYLRSIARRLIIDIVNGPGHPAVYRADARTPARVRSRRRSRKR